MNVSDFASLLDADELALAVHLHVVNRPLVEAGPALGWTHYRVERTRRRLARKLERASGQRERPTRMLDDSPPRNSMPQYFERLDSGRRLWSMRPLAGGYVNLIADSMPTVDEFSYVDENNKSVRIAQRVGRRINAMEVVAVNLERDLIDARKTLTRIQEQRADGQRNLTILTAKYADAQAADRKASEDEVLEGRIADKQRGRKLDALKVELMEAETALEVLARAIERAQGNVDAIAGEINSQQLEILRAKFEPSAVKLFGVAEAAAEAASGIRKTLSEVGSANLTEVLFPLRNAGAADYRTHQERHALMNFYNAAFALLNIRESGTRLYDRKAEAA